MFASLHPPWNKIQDQIFFFTKMWNQQELIHGFKLNNLLLVFVERSVVGGGGVYAADEHYHKSNSQEKVKGSFSSDIEHKRSFTAYKPSSSLSINLQLLCFIRRDGATAVPSDMFVL